MKPVAISDIQETIYLINETMLELNQHHRNAFRQYETKNSVVFPQSTDENLGSVHESIVFLIFQLLELGVQVALPPERFRTA